MQSHHRDSIRKIVTVGEGNERFLIFSVFVDVGLFCFLRQDLFQHRLNSEEFSDVLVSAIFFLKDGILTLIFVSFSPRHFYFFPANDTNCVVNKRCRKIKPSLGNWNKTQIRRMSANAKRYGTRGKIGFKLEIYYTFIVSKLNISLFFVLFNGNNYPSCF